MPHVSIEDVQQWLERTKLEVLYLDVELEVSAFELASSALAARYDPSLWINEATTPKLVQSVMSMTVAGWMYNRQYSEEAVEGSSWGNWLLNYSRKILSGLAEGNTLLPDVPGSERADWTLPAAWPNDASTLLAETEPTNPNASPRMFTMGQVF